MALGPFVPGELVGDKYRVECVLAKSEHAMLLAAWDEVLERGVALKLLPTVRHPRRIARFVREARSAAKLESDHVVRILDVGTIEGGMPFMVLERLEGFDLGELLGRDGPLPPARIADYVLQACEGLAHAHVAGIVHRDVKPQNLFLAARADGVTLVKIVDFGIAKAAEQEREATLTGSISLLGSPTYMSPEQLESPKDVDPRADIWSLGVVMYKLATGRPPFAGETFQALAANVARGAPAPIGKQGPGYAELERIVLRCLRKAPVERFADVLSLAQELAPLAPARAAEVIPRIAFVCGASPVMTTSSAPVPLPEGYDATIAMAEADRPRPPGGDANVQKAIGIGVTAVAALVVVVLAIAFVSSARGERATAGAAASAAATDPAADLAPPPTVAIDPAPPSVGVATSTAAPPNPTTTASATSPSRGGRPGRGRGAGGTGGTGGTGGAHGTPPTGPTPPPDGLPKALGGRI